MFNPQTAHTTGSERRSRNRFATTWMPSKIRDGDGWRKKDPVNEGQRSLRMKKVSQRAMLLMLLTVFIVGLSGLAYVVLLRSDIFKLTDISVVGNQVTTRQQVLQAAGLRKGNNLLTLDVQLAESLIREEQWIDQVQIKRYWPSTITITVQEYKPFALINLKRDGNRQLYYMDKKGVVFAPSTAEKDLDYPVVNGFGLSEQLQGKKFKEGTPGAMALEFLKLTAKGNQILPTQAVSEINVDKDGGLVVYLVDHPFPIYMGKEKIKIRFYRLIKVLAKLYDTKKIEGVAEIRMDYADNKILVSRMDDA